MKTKGMVPFILAFFLLFNIPSPRAANKDVDQKPLEVVIKTGVHEGFIRIVFFMEESYVRDASVTQIDNTIKVNLNAPVFFKLIGKEIERDYIKIDSLTRLINGLIFEPKKEGCILKKEDLTHIKTLKLSNPSRLVIDIYFSKLDVKTDKHSKYNVIMIDPGHGGYDKRIYGDNFSEKHFVLAFSKALLQEIEKSGKKAILLRNGDYAISMKDRIRIVNKKRPDILISIHLSLKDEVVIYLTESRIKKDRADQFLRESELISKSIIANIKSLGIKVKSQRIDSIIGSYAFVPSIFIELPNPERFAYDKKINQQIISAILKSLHDSSDSSP